MGDEAICRVTYAGEAAEGKALLETNEIIFRAGEFRLKVPFSEISSLAGDGGELRFVYKGREAVFQIGRDAERWAAKIRSPRGLLEKLGVKQGMRVAVIGVDDDVFLEQLRSRASVTDEQGDLDLIFYAAGRTEDLDRLEELGRALKPNGGIWVVSPKGKTAALKDTDVMAVARAVGLVDNKVVGFSATHTALRLVIPVALRR
jgi:hypothetical protein